MVATKHEASSTFLVACDKAQVIDSAGSGARLCPGRWQGGKCGPQRPGAIAQPMGRLRAAAPRRRHERPPAPPLCGSRLQRHPGACYLSDMLGTSQKVLHPLAAALHQAAGQQAAPPAVRLGALPSPLSVLCTTLCRPPRMRSARR